MDIFGFQFAYSPTALSGIGAFAIFAMIVATAAFAVAYLAGVVMTARIVGIRERRREAKKKKRLRDLLAMKAAQDELDVELEREMHGIRPTNNLEEFAILHEHTPEETAQLAAEAAAPAELAAADTRELLKSVLAETSAQPIAESAPEPETPVIAASEPVIDTSTTEEAHEAPALGFSFAAEPSSEAVAESAPEPIVATAEPEPSTPFGFSFAAEPEAATAPEPEPLAQEAPAESEAPVFGFSFATAPEPAPEPVPESAAPRPEVEMSSFFRAS